MRSTMLWLVMLLAEELPVRLVPGLCGLRPGLSLVD